MAGEYQGAQYDRAITPSDTEVFDQPRAVWLGAGDIVFGWSNGEQSASYTITQAGVYAFEPVMVYATGTTVTDIKALY